MEGVATTPTAAVKPGSPRMRSASSLTELGAATSSECLRALPQLGFARGCSYLCPDRVLSPARGQKMGSLPGAPAAQTLGP